MIKATTIKTKTYMCLYEKNIYACKMKQKTNPVTVRRHTVTYKASISLSLSILGDNLDPKQLFLLQTRTNLQIHIWPAGVSRHQRAEDEPAGSSDPNGPRKWHRRDRLFHPDAALVNAVWKFSIYTRFVRQCDGTLKPAESTFCQLKVTIWLSEW